MFTNEVPFWWVADHDIFSVIAKRHKRLPVPKDDKVFNRGMTADLWRLISHASEPLPDNRPEFARICEVTERLAEERRDLLAEGDVVLEPEPAGRTARQFGDEGNRNNTDQPCNSDRSEEIAPPSPRLDRSRHASQQGGPDGTVDDGSDTFHSVSEAGGSLDADSHRVTNPETAPLSRAEAEGSVPPDAPGPLTSLIRAYGPSTPMVPEAIPAKTIYQSLLQSTQQQGLVDSEVVTEYHTLPAIPVRLPTGTDAGLSMTEPSGHENRRRRYAIWR